MWIDRAFVISGAGTVVTGTLTDGALQQGDEVAIWPGGDRARIRGLQSHEHSAIRIEPGNRTAVNLAGLSNEVARGAMLGTVDGSEPSGQALVDLRLVRGLDRLTAKGAYQLHVGTGAWPVRLRPVAGGEIVGFGAAVVTFDSPLPVEMGDRVILRETGRRTVVAGGRVLDPAPAGRLARVRAAVPMLREAIDNDAAARANALLDARGSEHPAVLAAHSGGGAATAGINAGAVVLAAPKAAEMTAEMLGLVQAFHALNPMRPGAPKATLASQLDVSLDVVEALVAASSELVDDGATIRTTGFTQAWTERHEKAWQAAREVLLSSGLAVPRASQLGLDDETFHALLRDGRLHRVAEDLVFLPEQIDRVLERLAALEDGFTVAQFRDALGVSRRHAVPLLEWLDARGHTGRRGDERVIRRRPEPGPSSAPPR